MVEALGTFAVVGEARDGQGAVEQASALDPDIVILDLSMPGTDSIDTITNLRRRHSAIEILVFSLYQSDHRVMEAIGAGARAYVCKSETEHLVPALAAISAQQAYFSPTVRDAMLESDYEAWDRRPLTSRERAIVRLVAEGHSNKEIALLLKISVKTIETHRAAAMRKTGTNSTAGLTMYALRNAIVEL